MEYFVQMFGTMFGIVFGIGAGVIATGSLFIVALIIFNMFGVEIEIPQRKK